MHNVYSDFSYPKGLRESNLMKHFLTLRKLRYLILWFGKHFEISEIRHKSFRVTEVFFY